MTTTRGQHLIGKEIGSCILERLLGYGGSSAVFLAHSLTLEEPVAVKVFLPRSTLDGAMRKSFYRRFLREAEAASQLDHPNILTIYAYGEHEGMPYIVMPYMPGGTLAEHVQQHGPLSLQEARRYLEQIAAALDYAHANGCIHCDVKPANILLDSAGGAALSDFGIVRLVQNEKEATEAGSGKSGEILMGTPDYVSPEQALGEKLDGRSDVYSLGATLYYLLTGEPPFKAESPIALALMHVHEAPTPLGLLRADVTPQIDFVLSKVLAKWPEDRFQTPGAFYAAFELAVREAGEAPQFSLKHARLAKRAEDGEQELEELPSAPPIVQIKPVSPRLSFNPWRLVLTLGLVVALLLGCLLTALFIGNMDNSRVSSRVATATLVNTSKLRDALMDDRGSWPTSSTFFFKTDGYHLQNRSSNGLTMAFYSNYQFENFSLSVTTAEISGSFNSADYYGVIFRASADQTRYYLFEVTAWNEGQYGFLRYDGSGHWFRLADGRISNFQVKAGQKNTLSITASDDTFSFAINGKQTGKMIRDSSNLALSAGEVGLVVEQQSSEVSFSRLYISQK